MITVPFAGVFSVGRGGITSHNRNYLRASSRNESSSHAASCSPTRVLPQSSKCRAGLGLRPMTCPGRGECRKRSSDFTSYMATDVGEDWRTLHGTQDFQVSRREKARNPVRNL